MLKERMKENLIYSGAGITLVLSQFIEKSLAEIAIWLLVSGCVIMLDWLSKSYKIYKRHDEHWKFSRGIRSVMAKAVVYFAFVVTAVFVQNASGITSIAKWACLAVIVGESISILGNILKAHGYDLDTRLVIQTILGKVKLDKNMIKEEEKKDGTSK